MISIVIKDCKDKKQEVINTLKDALKESPGYENNEILVTDEPKGTDRILMLIGNANDKDISYEVSYHDLLPIE